MENPWHECAPDQLYKLFDLVKQLAESVEGCPLLARDADVEGRLDLGDEHDKAQRVYVGIGIDDRALIQLGILEFRDEVVDELDRLRFDFFACRFHLYISFCMWQLLVYLFL